MLARLKRRSDSFVGVSTTFVETTMIQPLACARTVGAAALVCAALFASATGAQSTGDERLATATFAGGCFWCMEPPFDALDGVVSTTSGYIGGHTENPTYLEVSSGKTGHTEAVQIVYDPEKISYERLLDVFWVNIDPTDADGQFCDRGSQYRPGIFYHDDAQRTSAEQSKAALAASKPFEQPLAIEIQAATIFYAAEEYHQNYYQKNPFRYKFYRAGCGRDRRLQELWGERAGGKE
jgi:peptide-methionine (S)-S-oxide reductase